MLVIDQFLMVAFDYTAWCWVGSFKRPCEGSQDHKVPDQHLRPWRMLSWGLPHQQGLRWARGALGDSLSQVLTAHRTLQFSWDGPTGTDVPTHTRDELPGRCLQHENAVGPVLLVLQTLCFLFLAKLATSVFWEYDFPIMRPWAAPPGTACSMDQTAATLLGRKYFGKM